MKKALLFLGIILPVCALMAQTLDPGVPGALEDITPDGVVLTVSADRGINHGATSIVTLVSTAAGKRMLFSAKDTVGGTGNELWISDGTKAGTLLLKDINPGAADSDPAQFIPIGNTTYFAATSASHGRELWKTDGTEAGTVMVADLNEDAADANPDYLTEWNGKLVFRAVDTYSDNIDPELRKAFLYISDGTQAGTTRVYNVVPTPGNWSEWPLFNSVGDKFVFPGDDGVYGVEMWASDGTQEGTYLLLDINYLPKDSANMELGTQGLYIDWMQRVGEKQVQFRPNPPIWWLGDSSLIGNTNNEPWVTDGTALGTYPLKDINPTGTPPNTNNSGYGEGFLFKNLLWFRANDGVHNNELQKSDLTTEGTGLFADLNGRVNAEGGSGASATDWHTIFGNYMFFACQVSNVGWEENLLDSLTGKELYYTDGTPENTFLYADIIPGSTNSNPNNLCVVNGKLYFVATDASGESELWCADYPTTPGEGHNYYRVFDGPGNSLHTNLRSFNGILYMVSSGGKFYKYDDGVTPKETEPVDNWQWQSVVEDHWVPYSNQKNIRVLAGEVDTCSYPGVVCIPETVPGSRGSYDQMGIYPNPAHTYFSLSFNSEIPAEVSLYNHLGQLVSITRTGRDERIDVSALPAGFYMVVAKFSDGKYAREKLLISR